MKDFLKTLVVPVVTYGILRGGEAVVAGVRSWRKAKKAAAPADK